MCSQAIMLVTDGATEMYDDVFEKYNWPERKVSHYRPLSPSLSLSVLSYTVTNFPCCTSSFCLCCSFLASGMNVDSNAMCVLEVLSDEELVSCLIISHNSVVLNPSQFAVFPCVDTSRSSISPRGMKHRKFTASMGSSVSKALLLIFCTSSWTQHFAHNPLSGSLCKT